MFQSGAPVPGPIRLVAAFRCTLWLAMLTAAATLLLPGAGRADLIVTTTADDGSPGTLRSQIDRANATGGDTIKFTGVPQGSEILFELDLEAGRGLPVDIRTNITLEGVPTRVGISAGLATAAGQGIFQVSNDRLTFHEVAISLNPGAGVDIGAAGELEVNTDRGDREWGEEGGSPFISGQGSFIKSGPNNLTIFGQPFYQGGTVVEDGDLILQDPLMLTGDFVFDPQDIDANPRLVFDNEIPSNTVPGAIRAGGTVVKRGSERLNFSAAIASDIVVEEGVMRASMAPSGDIEVQSGTLFEFDLDDTTTLYEGAMDGITGAGGITKLGSGELELMPGRAAYTGSTQIEAGRLKVTTTDTLPGNVVFTGDSELKFEITGAETFDKNITESSDGSVSGTVIKSGTAELHLTGNNSYSNLVVEDGDVRGNTNSIKGSVDLQGTTSKLIFQQDGTGTHNGSIQGADGAVIVEGAGTVTLSGTNSYGGGTTVKSTATLRGDGNSLQGTIMLEGTEATLVFDQTGSGTFETSDSVTGTGSVEKTGGGTLTVQGVWGHSGTTTLKAGGLILDGSLSSTDSVTVESGALLGGDGTISSDLDVSGVVAPGPTNAIGTLSVTGNVSFRDPSSFEVAIDDTISAANKMDRLDITGSAAIAANARLDVTPGPGDYATPLSQAVLTATSGITCTAPCQFDDIRDDLAFLALAVSRSANAVTVSIAQDNSQKIADVPGLDLNEQSVGDALDRADILNAGDELSAAFRPLTFAEVPGAIDELSGLPTTASFSTRMAESERFGRTVMRRMRIFADGGSFERDWTNAFSPMGPGSLLAGMMIGGPPATPTYGPSGSPGPGGWFNGYGSFGSVDASQQAPGFDYTVAGLATGVDHQFEAPFLLGGAFSYARIGIDDFTGANAKGSGNIYRTSLYGSYANRLGYLAAHADYAYSDMQNWRIIEIAPISERVRGSFGGNEVSGALELGSRPFERWLIRARPFVSVDYTYLGQDAFREATDSTLGLDVKQQSYNSLSTAVGATFDHTVQIDRTTRIRGELRLRYNHEFLDHRPVMRASFRGEDFGVVGVSTGRDTGLVGVSLEFIDRYNLSTFVGYDLRVNSQLLEHNVSLGVLFFF